MVSTAVVEAPIIAVCSKDRYMWVLTPESDRCMVCGGPPGGVIATRALTAEGELPPNEPRDLEPLIEPEQGEIEIACPDCSALLQIGVEDDRVVVRVLEPSNASPPSANGDSERREASSPGDDVDGADEPAAGHANPPAAGSPSQEEHDATAHDEQGA